MYLDWDPPPAEEEVTAHAPSHQYCYASFTTALGNQCSTDIFSYFMSFGKCILILICIFMFIQHYFCKRIYHASQFVNTLENKILLIILLVFFRYSIIHSNCSPALEFPMIWLRTQRAELAPLWL